MAALSSRDRWLTWAVRIVGLLVIGALAYLAYTVYMGQRQAESSSLASRAVANLEQAVKDNPDSPDAHILLGDAYRDTGRPSDAIKEYNTALELDPDHPVALSGLAIVAMYQEEWTTSQGYWQRAIEILSKNQFASQDLRLEKAYYYYGTVLIKLGEYEDAIANLKEALRIRRSDADTHYALSVAYREIGSPSNQREELEVALLEEALVNQAVDVDDADDLSVFSLFYASQILIGERNTRKVDRLESKKLLKAFHLL